MGLRGRDQVVVGCKVRLPPRVGPLFRCALEQTSEGSRERADLTVLDDGDRPLLVLELRLPDHQNPSPYDMSNVQNASAKAQMLGARWSGTSDAALSVLVDNSRSGPLITRTTQRIALDEPATRSTLDVPAQRAAIHASWVVLIAELAPVLRGERAAAPAAPDEFFVESLRALLARPVASIRDAISARKAADTAFREALVRWMVDHEGGHTHCRSSKRKSAGSQASPPMSSQRACCSTRPCAGLSPSCPSSTCRAPAAP